MKLAFAIVAILLSGYAQAQLPLVKVVATGGTIANTPSGRLHAGEVAEAIPQLKKVARLEVEEVIRVGSSSISIDNWLTLARKINDILQRYQTDVLGGASSSADAAQKFVDEAKSNLK